MKPSTITFPASPASRWRFRIYFQRPHIGSRWYRGNFSLGLMMDSHPRFVNLIAAFVITELVFSFYKE